MLFLEYNADSYDVSCSYCKFSKVGNNKKQQKFNKKNYI